MNLYIRYFDDECVVKSVDEALNFISNIQGFNMTPQFVDDFRQYAEGTMPYPKRYKVRARIYFIVIKTTAETLAEFKAHGKALQDDVMPDIPQNVQEPAKRIPQRLNEERIGWYEGTVKFKRVIQSTTGKFNYKDATFSARVKAHSPQDCYNRIISYLHSREDIDPRSQYPSVKGKNFKCQFVEEPK